MMTTMIMMKMRMLLGRFCHFGKGLDIETDYANKIQQPPDVPWTPSHSSPSSRWAS